LTFQPENHVISTDGARMGDCITSVQTWLVSNRLKLNPAKTDAVRLGTSRRVHPHLVACSSAPLILYNCTVPPFSRLNAFVTLELLLTLG